MNILALGAGGFIGSHLTHRLLEEGHTVTAVDVCSEKVGEILDHPRLRFLQQDIRSREWNLDAMVEPVDLVIDSLPTRIPASISVSLWKCSA